jgi:hypothetical protein
MSNAFSLPDPLRSASTRTLRLLLLPVADSQSRLFRVLGCLESCMLAEHHQVEQGVRPQTIRAVDGYTRTFTRRKQTGESCTFIVHNHFAVFIGRDAAHGVMRRRLDGHHLCDRVHAKIDAAESTMSGIFCITVSPVMVYGVPSGLVRPSIAANLFTLQGGCRDRRSSSR